MKTIVTHLAPDVDAVTSVWLLKRFLPGWSEAEVAFVPAGKTLNNDPADIDPEILHTDTGMGMLDHHQTDDDTCAARRCLEYIEREKEKSATKRDARPMKFPDEALIRLVDVVNDIDHFREVYYPNPTADFYNFSLVSILDGWKLIFSNEHHKVVEQSMIILDGIYRTFQNKIWAENEITQKGVEFTTEWGKGIGIETINDEVVRISQLQGYSVAVRKDPKKGFVRIKGMPDSMVDFTKVYEVLKERDKQATWFLHASKKMVLNGSIKNPESKPSTLTLQEIIEVLKKADK